MTDHALTLLKFLRDHRDEEFGGIDLSEGTGLWSGPMYVALIPLERDGLVSARWEELPEGVSRPRRRFYRITPEGETALSRAGTPPEEAING